jgi:hypothetical protein
MSFGQIEAASARLEMGSHRVLSFGVVLQCERRGRK